MEREIKFKGKRTDNGLWVYGHYVKDPQGNHRIYHQPFTEASSNTYHFVKPETIGQFIGILDKNGGSIYEGDIVQMPNWDYPVEVIFSLPKARFCCKLKKDVINDYVPLNSIVIGNIHEKPRTT